MSQIPPVPQPDHGSAVLAFSRATAARIHRLVARLNADETLLDGEPSRAAVLAEARAVMRESPMFRGREAALQQMAQAALAYWRELVPLPRARFEFLGGELQVGPVRVDGAFRSRISGRIFFDEIKTGTWHDSAPLSHQLQVSTYLAAGVIAFGGAFTGIRYLNLRDPAGRFWVHPDGYWDPYRPEMLAEF